MSVQPTVEPASSPGINLPYTIFELVVAVVAVVGNLLVILAFRRERRLRRRTNYYIVSLAAADLLVGLLGVPCALLTSLGLPSEKHSCLFTTSLLVVLCTISIFCLVAVSVDRYWAILHPMGYSRNVRTRTAIGIICACWVAGSTVGFLPLMGVNRVKGELKSCYFEQVMSPQFLVFLYFATIIGPAVLMAAFYAHIYTVVLKQLRQMVTVNGTSSGVHGSMLRVLGAARKREVKATQNLSIIVLFFMVCWIPLYTINFIQAYFEPWHAPSALTAWCIILTHLNSAGNPLLYAYHLKDFRAVLRSLLFGSKGEKAFGRDLTIFQETAGDRIKRANSVSTVYAGPPVAPLVRGHKRSNTVPLCLPVTSENGLVLTVIAGDLQLSKRKLDLNLSIITENSNSEDIKSMNTYQTQDHKESENCSTNHTTVKDSPVVFIDEKKANIYGLGLVPESPISQEINGELPATMERR